MNKKTILYTVAFVFSSLPFLALAQEEIVQKSQYSEFEPLFYYALAGLVFFLVFSILEASVILGQKRELNITREQLDSAHHQNTLDRALDQQEKKETVDQILDLHKKEMITISERFFGELESLKSTVNLLQEKAFSSSNPVIIKSEGTRNGNGVAIDPTYEKLHMLQIIVAVEIKNAFLQAKKDLLSMFDRSEISVAMGEITFELFKRWHSFCYEIKLYKKDETELFSKGSLRERQMEFERLSGTFSNEFLAIFPACIQTLGKEILKYLQAIYEKQTAVLVARIREKEDSLNKTSNNLKALRANDPDCTLENLKGSNKVVVPNTSENRRKYLELADQAAGLEEEIFQLTYYSGSFIRVGRKGQKSFIISQNQLSGNGKKTLADVFAFLALDPQTSFVYNGEKTELTTPLMEGCQILLD